MLKYCLDYLVREWVVLKSAPFAFITLMLLSVIISGIGWRWYFSDRIDIAHEENSRLSQALGLEKN